MVGPSSIVSVVVTVGQFYIWLIIAYVLLSWLPDNGIIHDIRRVLGTLVEPYLSLFRRFIPPIGAIDISPIVAIFALQLVMIVLTRV